MARQSARLVLVIDQAEQLFTLADERSRTVFLRAVDSIVTGGAGAGAVSQALVVVALRGDFLGRAGADPMLSRAIAEGPVLVGPMSGVELTQAIRGPAGNAGVEVPEALITAILRDLRGGSTDTGRLPGDPGPVEAAEGEVVVPEALERSGEQDAGQLVGLAAFEVSVLPLVSQIMYELWPDHQVPRLRVADYDRIGGVLAIVQTSAERVFAGLTLPQQGIARAVFVHLCTTVTGQVARNPASAAVLARAADAGDDVLQVVLEQFAAQRLLTRSANDMVDIAHDELIRSWPRLTGWLTASADDRELQRSLVDAVGRWVEHGRERSYLYRGSQLEATARAVRRRTAEEARLLPVTTTAREFLDLSLRRDRRQRRIGRAVTVVLGVLAVVAGSLVITTYRNAQRSDAQRAVALSRQFAAESRNLTTPAEAPLAERLAAAALAIAPTAEARDAAGAVLSDYHNRLAGDPGEITTLAYSQQGVLASAGTDKVIRLWDPRTGAQIGKPLTGHTAMIRSLAFSPDGRMLASAAEDKTVRLWNPATGREIGGPLLGHTDAVRGVAFGPDGKVLASAGDDRTVRLWDPQTAAEIGRPLTGHTQAIYGIAFSPDGRRLASVSLDKTIRLWDPATQTEVGRPLSGHGQVVISVAFSPDGKLLATASPNEHVRLWNPATGAPVASPLTGQTTPVFALAFGPDGNLAVAGGGGKATVRVWNPVTGVPVTGDMIDPGVPPGPAGAVAFSPDGDTVAAASVVTPGVIRLWNAHTGSFAGGVLTGHRGAIYDLAFRPGQPTLVSAGDDETVRRWDTDSDKPAGAPLTGVGATAVAFDPTGAVLATGLLTVPGSVQLWNPDTSQPIGKPLLGPVHASVTDVAFSADGRLLAGAGADGTVQLWDPATGDRVGPPVEVGSRSVEAVAFSPDGRRLAIGLGDGTIRLWDPQVRSFVGAPLRGHATGIGALAFSPDSATLYSSDNTSVRRWNVVTGTGVGKPLAGSQVRLSQDGKLLAMVDAGGAIRLRDPATGSEVGPPLVGTGSGVQTMAFSPDGTLLASGDNAGVVRVWDLSLYTDPVVALCRQAGGLTASEWTTYASGESPVAVCR